MKKFELPQTDSIRELAEFWDTHELTDCEDSLEEVAEPVFSRDPGNVEAAIQVLLEPQHALAVAQMARARGLSREQLVRSWVLQEIARSHS